MDSLNIAPVKDFKNEEETMLNRISSVLHVLESDSFTDEQKSNALHSIISNVVYDKKADKLDVFYALYWIISCCNTEDYIVITGNF